MDNPRIVDRDVEQCLLRVIPRDALGLALSHSDRGLQKQRSVTVEIDSSGKALWIVNEARLGRPCSKYLGEAVVCKLPASDCPDLPDKLGQIGRASCRERVCQYV